MATNLPFCFYIQFLEQLLEFLVNFTLLKYVKSQRSYGFLITKELIFGFQILDLKVHFSASLNSTSNYKITGKETGCIQTTTDKIEPSLYYQCMPHYCPTARRMRKAPHDENSAILGQLKMAECEPYQLTVDR